jgi:hypothetical protein
LAKGYCVERTEPFGVRPGLTSQNEKARRGMKQTTNKHQTKLQRLFRHRQAMCGFAYDDSKSESNVNGQRHHETFRARAAARSEAKTEADKIDNES